MKIVRHDHIGTVDVRLVRRPTNTAVGIDNWHLYVGCGSDMPSSIVRHLGTDPDWAQERYNIHVEHLRDLTR